jgi:membrane-associated phospholipid phosphatase
MSRELRRFVVSTSWLVVAIFLLAASPALADGTRATRETTSAATPIATAGPEQVSTQSGTTHGEPTEAGTGQGGTTQEPVPPGGAPHTGFKTLIKDTGGDFKHTFTDKEPLLWLAGGLAAAGALHPLDDNVTEHFAGDSSHNFFKPGKVIGYGAVQIGTAIGTWAYGRMTSKHGRAAHVGLDLLRAQIVTQTVTYGLKYTVRRDRPDGTSGYSFPSGHASTTFATASVLERHFGWKAGIPTYMIATYVATSRLYENRHFLTDVVFGAALGMAAGRSVTRHGRDSFTLVPMVAPGLVGIMVTRTGV